MKVSAFTLAAVAQVASAHYFFDTNIVNGAMSQPNQYIRESTRQTKYNPIKFSSNPPQDIRDNSHADSEDIRCNQGAFQNAGKTEVLEVNAGDEVRVHLAVGATMQHPGPSLAYLSRAPNDNVKSYDGSGDWFKIYEEGVCNQGADFTTNAWCSWGKNELAAVIPKDTPNGEYLFRAEHIGIHRSHVNQPEHYTSCVQIKVVNGGNGTPGPMVQFPGAYKDSDPYATFSIYGGAKDFPFPGPEVWSGGAASGGASTGGGSSGAAPSTPAPSGGAGSGGDGAPSGGAPSGGAPSGGSDGGVDIWKFWNWVKKYFAKGQ